MRLDGNKNQILNVTRMKFSQSLKELEVSSSFQDSVRETMDLLSLIKMEPSTMSRSFYQSIHRKSESKIVKRVTMKYEPLD